MAINATSKINKASLHVIKTLLTLMEDNYTMSELLEKLNSQEKESIFNNSIICKYINTCRYCGFEIPKVCNRYYVTKVPFGFKLNEKDLKLLDYLKEFSQKNFSTKTYYNFLAFYNKLSKTNDREIYRISEKDIEKLKNIYKKAVFENKEIILIVNTNSIIECKPISIIEKSGKEFFNVLYKNQENIIPINKIVGIEISNKKFKKESENPVVFKLKGDLAKRYFLKEDETILEKNKEENYIVISNNEEDKNELLTRLLRYDSCCEVLSPQYFRNEIRNILKNMLSNYED